jgi:hypothetical protein
MTPALRPEAALAWLRSLSAGLRAAAVLDAGGVVVAGDPALGPRVAAGDPALVVVRSERHAIAAQPGRHALRGLLALDARAALDALERARAVADGVRTERVSAPDPGKSR